MKVQIFNKGFEDVEDFRAPLYFLDESNRIEGVYDGQSMDDAIKAWQYLIKQDVLNIDVVLKTHKILMRRQKLDPKYIGKFRDINVGIQRNGVIVKKFIDPKLVAGSMNSWLFLANSAKSAKYVEEWIKQAHQQYINIHPFVDGNGRTGRMFMNWSRVKMGLPLLIICEEDKQEYYKWFK